MAAAEGRQEEPVVLLHHVLISTWSFSCPGIDGGRGWGRDDEGGDSWRWCIQATTVFFLHDRIFTDVFCREAGGRSFRLPSEGGHAHRATKLQAHVRRLHAQLFPFVFAQEMALIGASDCVTTS